MSSTGTINPYKYRARALTFFTLISLSNVIPPKFWFQEVLHNLGTYFLIAHLFSLLFIAVYRVGFGKYFKFTVFLQFIAIGYYLIFSWNFLLSPLSSHQTLQDQSNSRLPEKINLLYANVYTANTRYEELRNIIHNNKPEIIGLIEINSEWINSLDLEEEYPFKYELPREDNFGIGIYSKFPFINQTPIDLGADIAPALYGELKLKNEKVLKVILLHCIPPLSQEALYHNRLLLRRAGTKVRFSNEPVIFMGDLNATPYSYYYRRLINWGGLRSALWGNGLIRTWNVGNPLIRLHLDHILYKGPISIKGFNLLPEIGSDHAAILTKLEIY